MTHKYTLPLCSSQADLATVGGKGASLSCLALAGLPVPDGFHITTKAYHRFIAENRIEPKIRAVMQTVDSQDIRTFEQASTTLMALITGGSIPADVAAEVTAAYEALADHETAVAVRSSATAEDLPEASFAGQQETYLNIIGARAVLEAARKCWAALWTARAIAYRSRQGIGVDGIGLAVVVQQLVPADASGILFTANPLNGSRHEAVINAAWGLGEAVVGGLVTPDSLTVDKLEFRVEKADIAEKMVRTVRMDHGTMEQPVPDDLKGRPVLTNMQARELTIMGNKIERLYGMPMDIEWALAGKKFHILQARPITALPEPEGPVPEEWAPDDPKTQYMRVSICELLPEPVSPLFDTLALRTINEGIGLTLHDLFRLDPDILEGFIATVNGYAYERVRFTARQWFELVARMVPHFPRMLKVGVGFWKETAHPRYRLAAETWAAFDPETLPAHKLFEGIQDVMGAFGYHLGALMTSTMGPTAGSEGLFTAVYTKLVRQEDDPEAPVFLMGFDSAPIRSAKALYDLAEWCRTQPLLLDFILNTPADQLHNGAAPAAGLPASIREDWESRLARYLEAHGYAIYDMDFAKPLPMDQPEPLLEMLKGFLSGKVQNPYERQEAYELRRQAAEAKIRPRLKGLKRWAFEKSLGWAQSQAPLREDGLAEIGLGYPVVRTLLREIGRRLVQANVLSYADDVYWLEEGELEHLTSRLDSGEAVFEKFQARVARRKAAWQGRKRATPPAKINIGKKFMGVDVDSFLPSEEDDGSGIIKGVATSPGKVTGRARVLHGPEDFDRMEFGEILVAGITTPAWTPLFAMASAVVTDIGGPLSHGSIVAREYGIPAVLGTGVATRRIRSGQTITVDGGRGIVILAQ